MPSRRRMIVHFLVILLGLVAAQDGVDPTDDCHGRKEPLSSSEWAWRMSIVVLLNMLSALFSGLTLGLMSLDKVGLEIVMGAGEAENASEEERKFAEYAKTIYPVRENGNLLLTTLLLGNVAVNALLSIVLADLFNGTVGFLVSTAIIVIFGEILPQALCSRYALKIGSYAIPIVKLIMLLLYILAKPISVVLDKMLGEEIGTIHSKLELMKMLEIHVKQKAIDVEEGHIMHGAISYKTKPVSSVMTPIDEIFMLPVTSKLNFKLIRKIFESGYSRIPVCGKDANDIVGLLFVKDLIFVDPEDETPLLNFIHIFGRGVHKVWPDSKLGDVLKLFKMGRGHLALVNDVDNTGPGDPHYVTVGLITLEDIIEEILQDEIVDETDVFVEVEKRSKVNRRSFDYGRLRLLDSRLVDETLENEEVNAVAAHLFANYPQFKFINIKGKSITEDQLKSLLRKCAVMELDPRGQGKEKTSMEPLYTRGETVAHCTVILQGKVRIKAGREGFESEVGSWTVLAADSLIMEDNAYCPDFTAILSGTERVRLLHISRVEFQQLLYPLTPVGRGSPKRLSS